MTLTSHLLVFRWDLSFSMTNTFPKQNHLCGVKKIEKLHSQGNAFISYPLRIVYLVVDDGSEETPVRVMVSVSKKKFKHAVKRNRIKRLMREAYRLNNDELTCFTESHNLQIHIAFQYIASSEETFDNIAHKMRKAIAKLISNIYNKNIAPHENAKESN